MPSRRIPVGPVLAALFLLSACSSNDSNGAEASGGSSGGMSSSDSGESSRGASGTRAGADAEVTLAAACSAMCSSQSASACPDPQCQDHCVQGAGATPSATRTRTCSGEYQAMARCEATLHSNQWTCSIDENTPIAQDGQCTATVCAWACCATDLIAPSDIWARCMPTCGGSSTRLHAAAAKAAATAKNCAYVDLTALSTAWYNSIGNATDALKFHAEGGATHTNLAGADKLAQILAKAIKDHKIGLAKYLRP